MKCIGATTYTEFRGVFEKDHALSRRFQKIDVNEPTVEQTVQILRGLKSRFEEHHGVKYSGAALTSAAELAARFINDRHLPDKAIDVIDEAGAAQRILPKSKQKKTIGKSEIDCEIRADEGDPADVLVRLADECGADLLVIGNKGMKRRLLGSVPNTVTHKANCSVLVVKTS